MADQLRALAEAASLVNVETYGSFPCLPGGIPRSKALSYWSSSPTEPWWCKSRTGGLHCSSMNNPTRGGHFQLATSGDHKLAVDNLHVTWVRKAPTASVFPGTA